MEQQKAIEWFIEQLKNEEGIDFIPTSIIEQAKQMENEQKRQKLIGLLDWMNKVATDNPMAFETDNDDIVDMYLTGYYK